MSHVRFTRVGVAVAAGLLAGMWTSGVAWATTVTSDRFAFSGILQRNPTPPPDFFFRSTQCILASDNNEPNFPCQVSGTLTKTATGYSGTSTTTSKDGKISSTFTLTPTTTAGQYTLKGTATETETEGGKTEKYATTVVGTWKLSPAAGTISGTTKVLEASTAP